ncbi:hypothetical protein [Agrobacterium vitis]|uniref:Uncharacterized protein n=1 Tax=Agrobacterium vitis TaxID=373 RepID=A0AAE2RFJ5_AGRVI|nr:hypothetical protein [Agrobacterium vitis]MBF2717578.1 hypothetical protein [Agrobacterium vitis]
MTLNVASAEVRSWIPVIQVAAGATVGKVLDAFRLQIPLGYNSPEITFRRLGESFILGWCAAIKSENFGEIEGHIVWRISTYIR